MDKHDDILLMEAKNISKVYPGTKALNDVDFQIFKGKVNVLIGENGAGKSTLMKIVAGIQKPTDGKMIIYDERGNGEEVTFSSTREASRKGIEIVHQELNLFGDMSVAENIFMNREIKKFGSLCIDHAAQESKASEILRRLKQDIDPKTLVRDLRLGKRQIVEIAKTLVEDPKILIMDEPTSSLSIQEVDILFTMIRELKAQGVAIVYISHRLEELKQIGDYITILRDSRLVHTGLISELTIKQIVALMIGRDQKDFFAGSSHTTGKEILEVKDITLPRLGGGFTLQKVSFTLYEGEILGIYGLMGAGRTELLECLMGLNDKMEGDILLGGSSLAAKDTRSRIDRGMILIPEERQREGLFLNLSVKSNISMASLLKYVVSKVHVNREKEDCGVDSMIKEMSIKVANKNLTVNALSGGNQQKVVIGKCLLTKPKVLLMDEPTRGIDIGAKSDVFQIMGGMAEKGLGVIFVSSEMDEVCSMSDRIIVLSKGVVTGVFTRAEISEEKIRKASEIGHSLIVTA
ncbi:MAG: sugar ABC transporter ATP-binding protein [Sphaerochaeta sp.]|nr:sugar ABC transporter ATP-binding protein [Sphaerochaeta sp.]